MHLRIAVADDAAAIAAVLSAAFAAYRSLYTPAAFTATTPTSEQIQHRMREGPVWVAVQHDAIVGTVSAVPQANAVYIRSMAVLPAARGQGIAGRLLEAVERFAQAHGYKRLFL